MKIGVISDTHDQIANIERVVEILNQEKVELVIHCGDWVAPFALLPFEKLRCPIRGIFGNNDGDVFRHFKVAKRIGLNLTYEGKFFTFEIEKRKIAVYHGEHQEIVDALVMSGKYHAVFHGHTHIRVNKTVGRTLSLNSGTLVPKTSPEVFGASFAIYDTKTNSARIIDL